MTETCTDWNIIINPYAGSGKTLPEWEKAARLLDDNGISYKSVKCGGAHRASELAFIAAGQGYRKILAVGGDGSVHDVFRGILSWCESSGCPPEEFTVGVIPIGSGNDWIRSLGLKRDVAAMVRAIRDGGTAEEDVVGVTGSDGSVCYMANIGGVGFDSRVCDIVNRKKERGLRNRMIYVDALIQTIFGLKPIRVRITSDGKEVFSGEVYSIAMGNGRFSGSGMCQVPMASMDDGAVDMMIVPRVGVLKILRDAPRLFNGTMDRSSSVLFTRGKVLEITPLDAESSAIFEVDGEIEGRLPLRVECTGRRIRVIKER